MFYGVQLNNNYFFSDLLLYERIFFLMKFIIRPKFDCCFAADAVACACSVCWISA